CDGAVYHPGVDLRGAAAGGRAPAGVRHGGARPDAVGPRPVRGADAHQTRRRDADLQGPHGGGEEDRGAAEHRGRPHLRLLRGRQRPGAARLHQGAEGLRRPLHSGGGGHQLRVFLGQPVVPHPAQGAGHAGPLRQHQEADRGTEEPVVSVGWRKRSSAQCRVGRAVARPTTPRWCKDREESMAKKTASTPTAEKPAAATGDVEVLRQPAEAKYADELAYLASVDTSPRPFTWKLSPRIVRTFILGSRPADKL